MNRPLAFLALALMTQRALSGEPPLHWSRLPDLPDAEGFAGSFAGVSNGALIVAGGANIAGDKWADPVRKKWYDSVFVLERPDGKWQGPFHLHRPCAYGVSITTPEGMACLGGGDAGRHFSDAFFLRWTDGSIQQVPLPHLPQPCAYACGARVGHTLYVAGGSETPASTSALATFWALDLAPSTPSWQTLPPWPGPARILAVAGAQDGVFYLFGGASLHPDAAGKPARTYLRDAYAYSPATGWRRLADLPRPAVAAPSPALAPGGDELIVVSGDDGRNTTFRPVRQHPGFPRDLLIYHVATGSWETGPEGPFSWATAPTVLWNGGFVIPNGEVRPRVRTPQVWQVDAAAP